MEQNKLEISIMLMVTLKVQIVGEVNKTHLEKVLMHMLTHTVFYSWDCHVKFNRGYMLSANYDLISEHVSY